ncbi:hypothetical protein SISSUDRAFT_1068194 [Sistotremastrum suecicum HHB10207 ss-3]|uniref:Uncharacterized protein n=1 Tax=Sistotremastrum suecicum HHB10207 ss-3 TaxID=1314776 RepID=A0A165WDX0_9AGAM|nr:hypothetical protein SISSUDRAFT_1068194 [Sistotremastrum suecicum HHB10207 ss-3]
MPTEHPKYPLTTTSGNPDDRQLQPSHNPTTTCGCLQSHALDFQTLVMDTQFWQ